MGATLAVTTKDSFFELLEQAEVFTPEQLQTFKTALREVTDPKKVAGRLVHQGKLTKWQAGQLFAGRPQALHLGKYLLLDQLGAGAMGQVFLGEHTQMRRRVAIKTLARKHSNKPSSIERFLREARAIAALDHRNIIQAYDVDSEGDLYYLVMEYIEGQDLQQMIEERGPLPFAEIADYIRQAAAGLGHAHEKGLVHRDVKPANLLIDGSGTLKVLDLGVAQMNDDSDEGGQSNLAMLGTVDYVAPEQAENHAQIDHRADLYALGGTMYFLLTGKPPFPDGSLHQRLLARLQSDPKSILKFRPDAPQGLVRICRRLMARNPADRFASARDVEKALEKWQKEASQETTAITPAALPRGGKPSSGRSASVGGAPQASGGGVPKAQPIAESTAPPVVAAAPVAQLAEEPAADSPFAGFALNLDSSPAAASSAFPSFDTASEPPAIAAAAASPAAPAASVPQVEKKKIPASWWIAGGAIAAVFVLGGVIAWLTLGGKPAETVAANTSQDADAAKQDGAPATGETKPVENPENKADPPAGKSGEEQPGSGEPGAQPMPPDGTSPPVQPEGPKSEEPKPEEPKPAEPKPEEPKPTEPKPTEPKPEEPKPPEPPKPEPFAGFATLIELPALSREAVESKTPPPPITFGKINADKRDAVTILLFGGERAGKPKTVLGIRRGDRGLALRDWELFTDFKSDTAPAEGATPKPSSTAVVVATLKLQDDQSLVFSWTPQSLTEQNAPYLENCVLALQAAKKKHTLALRNPADAQPIVANFEKSPIVKTEIDLDHLPDPKFVRLEIAGLSAQFPQKVTYDPESKWCEASKGTIGIVFGDGDGLMMRVDSKTSSKTVTLTMTPYFKIEGMNAPEKLTFASFAAVGNRVLGAQSVLQRQLDAAKKAGQPGQAAAKAIEGQLVAVGGAVGQMGKLDPLVKALNKAGQIEYRIYADYATHQVTLAKTAGAAVPPIAREDNK